MSEGDNTATKLLVNDSLEKNLGPCPPTILKNVHSLSRIIFPELEAFKSDTPSDWLTVWFTQSRDVLPLNLQKLGGKKKKKPTSGLKNCL